MKLVNTLGDNSRVSQFLGWWKRELLSIVPPRLLRLVRGSEHWLIVDLSGERPVSIYERDKHPVQNAILETDLDGNLIRPQLSRAMASCQGMLRLQTGQALRRQVDLPLAAEQNLEEVLGF